jgi:hypothetical protein|tara:strand:- start:538 stop:795 length:258 start_codon:yes stop_codon:yes gene_type:complete
VGSKESLRTEDRGFVGRGERRETRDERRDRFECTAGTERDETMRRGEARARTVGGRVVPAAGGALNAAVASFDCERGETERWRWR